MMFATDLHPAVIDQLRRVAASRQALPAVDARDVAAAAVNDAISCSIFIGLQAQLTQIGEVSSSKLTEETMPLRMRMHGTDC